MAIPAQATGVAQVSGSVHAAGNPQVAGPAPGLASVASAPSAVAPPAVATASSVTVAPPATSARYLAPVNGRWDAAPVLTAQAPTAGRTIGLYAGGQVQLASLDTAHFTTSLVQVTYQPRIAATTLEAIDFYPMLPTNFVAYLTHLYFYVLPVCLGDTYRAQGRWSDALVDIGPR